MPFFHKRDFQSCHNIFLYGAIFLATLVALVISQVNLPIGQNFPGGVAIPPNANIPPNVNIPGQNIGPGPNIPGVPPGGAGGVLFTGTGTNPFYGVNLVPFGPENGDLEVAEGFLTAGQTVDLQLFFPFYGGWYNYTTISVNGYMAFATVLDQGPTINVGPDSTDWPRVQDPAMIAPYLCKQQINQDQIPGLRTGVFFRVLLRSTLFGRGYTGGIGEAGTSLQSAFFGLPAEQACPGTPGTYTRCDANSDYFLDVMMQWLEDGVAGGSMFRADAAIVVTWYNTAPAVSGRSDIDANMLATYQVIWLTDRAARLSYAILNYDKLGFDAADFRGNSRSGRCRALFNGGNHTGLVDVDPTQLYKNTPKVLAQRSGVPHVVRGRYMFRVDDVVRPGGCSNKTGGTYPILLYPNIINMLGEMYIDVNAMCLDRTQTYILMIEQRETANCIVLNPSIARCQIPRIYDWGTKTLYFQPQNGIALDEKSYVGYAYFVPPTLDPMRLDIGNLYDWYKNPLPSTVMPLSWFPRNFTNPDLITFNTNFQLSNDAIYSVQLGLYVIGYKEALDESLKKFRPMYRTIARLGTYTNNNSPYYRIFPQEERINVYSVEQWYLTDWERMNDLYTYRTGFLKLAPIRTGFQNSSDVGPGLVSAPISLHFLWTTNNPQFYGTTFTTTENEARAAFVAEKARQMCHDWYDEDGALENFIRDVETNASCPCIEAQARMDLGRFMPHPRCSQAFRDITCTETIGAQNCYMSAQNVYGSYASRNSFDTSSGKRVQTHYGQVCCYDKEGYLQQTTYEPVVKVIQDMFYNPGFPLRAYEFGATPYLGQFEVPGMSSFSADYMPYHLCCKFAKFRCQMFYWRRPSSACQNYQPPAMGYIMGGGSVNTIDNQKFIFNQPGTFNLLYSPRTLHTPEVRIQVRLERYPNRRVDWSLLGHWMNQGDLVQPSNITVVTGIALEATGTDRVVVTARGDTRRFRYRTNIIVGNILRYFDTMRLQRFSGVLIYVNNVERGQPEIYVVLEEAEVGVYISESYALDIDRLSMFQESMGFLSVEIGVPPKYGVAPDGNNFNDINYRAYYDLPRVSGLLRPFPDQGGVGAFYQGMTINDVNAEQYRAQIINSYMVPGTGGYTGIQQAPPGTLGQTPTDNMFLTSKDEDRAFDVFPEVSMIQTPIYLVAPKYQTGRFAFDPQTGQDLIQLLQTCRDLQTNPNVALQPLQSQLYLAFGINTCPDNPAQIIQDCGDSVPCMFDYTYFNSRTIGMETQNVWSGFQRDRLSAQRQYNSCGPINVEYPEYLTKTPAFGSGYLDGDSVTFGCFQTHWIKGDYEYKCSLVVDYNDPNNYRFEWNKGWQPWCRSREMENFFKWLAAIFGAIGIIIVILLIFLAFWCIKQKRRSQESDIYKAPIRPRSVSPPFTRNIGEINDAYEAEQRAAAAGRPTSPESELRMRQNAGSVADSSRPFAFAGLNTSV